MKINHIITTPENIKKYPGIITYKETWYILHHFKDFEKGQIIAVITQNDKFIWLNNDAEELFKPDMRKLERKEKLLKLLYEPDESER